MQQQGNASFTLAAQSSNTEQEVLINANTIRMYNTGTGGEGGGGIIFL